MDVVHVKFSTHQQKHEQRVKTESQGKVVEVEGDRREKVKEKVEGRGKSVTRTRDDDSSSS